MVMLFSRFAFSATILAASVFVSSGIEAKTYNIRPGVKYLVGQLVGWDGRCRSTGYAKVVIVTQPKYGRISTRRGRTFAIPRRVAAGKAGKCVGKRIRGVAVYYRAKSGFRGTDMIRYKARPANSKTYYTFTDTFRVR